MPPADDLASKLLADAFPQAGPPADVLSDPLVDTPMVVVLDQLRPYELNPRVARNPLFDEIKASIRQRGLPRPGSPRSTASPAPCWPITTRVYPTLVICCSYRHACSPVS